MIISRTPFRISLFGGGTDYPDWIRAHGGAVVGMAINKYCYLSVRTLPPFFTHKHRIVYSNIELVQEISDIQHPAVRGIFDDMKVTGGLEVHHDADLPARSGLGSSSSFTVGLLNALYAKRGRMLSKARLGGEAIRIEQQVLGEPVGCQDQIWAAHGGLNLIEFHKDGQIDVNPLMITRERKTELVNSLILVFSGVSRYSAVAAQEKVKNLGKNEQQLHRMRLMVDDAIDLLCDEREPITRIGELLHESWQLKRGLASSVTSQLVDDIYGAAMAAGASGGKLLGAGGGGFMAFIAAPEKRGAVIDALRGLIHVNVDVDHGGSRIMVYEPDGIGSIEPSADELPRLSPIQMGRTPYTV